MRWCKSCSAALEGEPTTAVRCAGCGADNPPLQAPPATPPAVRALAVGAMALVGIGFAILFFFKVEPPPDASEPPPRSARSARSAPRGVPLEVYRDELCFVDANGDDIPDPVVWASEGLDSYRAAVSDGKTGQGIWASPAWKGRWPIACADRGAVIVGAGEASVRAFDARTGKERWASAVQAAPQEIRTGQGCASVLTKGGALVGLELDTGKAAPCPSAPEPDPTKSPRAEQIQNPRVVQAGEMELRLSAATGDAPKLTLESRRGGAPVWTQPLNARAYDFGSDRVLVLVVSGGTAVVVGGDVSTGTRLRFLGVEASTGKVLYERPAPWAGPYIAAIAAPGPHLVVLAGGSVRAVDPATGEELWQATAPASQP